MWVSGSLDCPNERNYQANRSKGIRFESAVSYAVSQCPLLTLSGH